MDDRRAHFLTILGDACSAAGLASLDVELLLRDGRRLAGMPSPQPVDGGSPLEETGYGHQLLINGSSTDIENVVEFVIRSP